MNFNDFAILARNRTINENARILTNMDTDEGCTSTLMAVKQSSVSNAISRHFAISRAARGSAALNNEVRDRLITALASELGMKNTGINNRKELLKSLEKKLGKSVFNASTFDGSGKPLTTRRVRKIVNAVYAQEKLTKNKGLAKSIADKFNKLNKLCSPEQPWEKGLTLNTKGCMDFLGKLSPAHTLIGSEDTTTETSILHVSDTLNETMAQIESLKSELAKFSEPNLEPSHSNNHNLSESLNPKKRHINSINESIKKSANWETGVGSNVMKTYAAKIKADMNKKQLKTEVKHKLFTIRTDAGIAYTMPSSDGSRPGTIGLMARDILKAVNATTKERDSPLHQLLNHLISNEAKICKKDGQRRMTLQYLSQIYGAADTAFPDRKADAISENALATVADLDARSKNVKRLKADLKALGKDQTQQRQYLKLQIKLEKLLIKADKIELSDSDIGAFGVETIRAELKGRLEAELKAQEKAKLETLEKAKNTKTAENGAPMQNAGAENNQVNQNQGNIDADLIDENLDEMGSINNNQVQTEMVNQA